MKNTKEEEERQSETATQDLINKRFIVKWFILDDEAQDETRPHAVPLGLRRL